MIVSQWKVATDYTPPRRWFWVRIYDKPESLRAVASRVAPQVDHSNCIGTVQEITPWVPEDSHPDLQDLIPVSDLVFPENGCAGVIRLCVDWLMPEIVAHEILHAAVTVFRMNIRQMPRLEGLTAEERPFEEALAYAVGQLSQEMHEGLYSHGFE